MHAERHRGVISPAGRAILAELRRELGLAAERMEAEVLQPFRDDEEKLTRYRSAVMATLAARGNQPERILPKDWEELKELEQRLNKLGLKEGGAAEDRSRAPSTAADGPGAFQATQPDSQATSPADTAGLPLIQIPVTKGWLV